MPKEYINPSSLFPSLPHGFSQVVIASGRKMGFISGQTAWDARKNIVGGDSVLEQARQAFRNLEKAMEAAGGTLKDVVALRIYVVDYQAESGTAVGIALREFFSPQNPPASTMDRRLGSGSSGISDRDRSNGGVGLSLCTGNSREPAFDSFCARGGCAFFASMDAKLETAFVRDRYCGDFRLRLHAHGAQTA